MKRKKLVWFPCMLATLVMVAGCALTEQPVSVDIPRSDASLDRPIDMPDDPAALIETGVLNYSLGDMEQALDYYNQAVAIVHDIGALWYESMGRVNLAMLYAELGDLESAEQELEQAVAIDEQVNHPNLERDRGLLDQVRGARQD